MVAKIKSGKSLIGALNYNERKVAQGVATLILASRYVKDMDKLTFHDKLMRLKDLADGNMRTGTNTVHISLNFSNGEDLSEEKLKFIAQDYMKGIGFGGQPYLVYQHTDAGHPHIHIVTTNIKSDGARINLHYLGQNESEKTRKAIEIGYQLIKAGDQQIVKPDIKADLKAVDYGKAETKRSITNILGYVIHTYKFTSIPELNAALQQYNVLADQGSKDSRMYTQSGLLYWSLDERGEKIGVPVKASSIYGKPTLKELEARFRLNATLRKPFREPLMRLLDQVLHRNLTPSQLEKELAIKGIQIILRRSNEGRLYGVTYVDKNSKTVFKGSDLGKSYSANRLEAILLRDTNHFKRPTQSENGLSPYTPQMVTGGNDVMDILFQAEQQDLGALHKFRKRKRKGLNL
jgi:hypothetical protein